MPHITKVFGPPGTGKTHWMLNKLTEEIEAGTSVRRIAYVTYSRSAKEEAMSRAKMRLDRSKEGDFQFFKTIHGICFSEMLLSKAHVMRVADFMEFGKCCPVEFSSDYTEEYDMDGLPSGWINSPGNAIMNIRQVAAARKLSVFDPRIVQHHWTSSTRFSEIKTVLERYSKFKERECRFDFVDMLQMYSDNGDPLPIDVMFIDEAQDLSKMQWDLVHKMSANAKRVYIAGDDDQSIYGFMGADPFGFLDHPFDSKILLSRSYRLQHHIWEYAKKIIGKVKHREPKEVNVSPGGKVQQWGMNFPPDRVFSRMQSEIKKDETVMVIGATNYQLSLVRSDLENMGLAVSYRGRSFLETPEASHFYWYHKARKGEPVPIKQAIGLTKSLKLPSARYLADDYRLHPERKITPGEIENMGVKFISDTSSINYLAQSKRGEALYRSLFSSAAKFGIESIQEKPKISLQTFHSCKGREADHTIIMTDQSPKATAYAERDPDYDSRVAYVGVTRSKKSANIIENSTQYYTKGYSHVR